MCTRRPCVRRDWYYFVYHTHTRTRGHSNTCFFFLFFFSFFISRIPYYKYNVYIVVVCVGGKRRVPGFFSPIIHRRVSPIVRRRRSLHSQPAKGKKKLDMYIYAHKKTRHERMGTRDISILYSKFADVKPLCYDNNILFRQDRCHVVQRFVLWFIVYLLYYSILYCCIRTSPYDGVPCLGSGVDLILRGKKKFVR